MSFIGKHSSFIESLVAIAYYAACVALIAAYKLVLFVVFAVLGFGLVILVFSLIFEQKVRYLKKVK